MTTKLQNIDDLLTPTTLNDFLISDPVSRQLLFGILDGTTPFPAMGRNGICLWGTYGTGKTTLAKLLPELFESSGALPDCERGLQLIEFDRCYDLTACGSGQNSVILLNSIRSRIDGWPCYGPSGWHYEILDEADQLTSAAQAALKSLMTQGSGTIFILTTNNKGSLDAGVKDRCHLIEMNKAAPQQYVPIARSILQKLYFQGDEVTEMQIHQMAEASGGSFRDFAGAVVTLANRKHRQTLGSGSGVVKYDAFIHATDRSVAAANHSDL
jgi:hypothetical protein